MLLAESFFEVEELLLELSLIAVMALIPESSRCGTSRGECADESMAVDPLFTIESVCRSESTCRGCASMIKSSVSKKVSSSVRAASGPATGSIAPARNRG